MLKTLGRWMRGSPPTVAPLVDRAGPAPIRQAFRSLPKPATPARFDAYANLSGSDPAVLARMGSTARTRLGEDPAATQVPAQNLDMFLIEDFLSADECAHLVRSIDADVKPSTSLRKAGTATRRTSETCRLSPVEPIVADVERRIADALGLPLSHSETIQGQRYHPGQFFKMHNDYIAGGQVYSDAFAREGGQRTWTAMIFLDEPEQGGRTSFPRALVEIVPGIGTLLVWNNMTANGEPNAYSHHEGTEVKVGVKHVLTKWFRERPWSSSAESDALRA